MIKKNIILTVTEEQDSGEELLYTIKSVADRKVFILNTAAPEVCINNPDELLEAMKLVREFGEANPSEPTPDSKPKVTVNDPLKVDSLDNIPVISPITYGEG